MTVPAGTYIVDGKRAKSMKRTSSLTTELADTVTWPISPSLLATATSPVAALAAKPSSAKEQPASHS